MKINHVSASCLQNGPVNLDLHPVTVIYGKSFGGKTSVLNAVQLGLLGYVPQYGVRGTMGLASGSKLEVLLDVDGRNYRRCWSRDGKGKVSFEGHEGPLVPPILLDVREHTEGTAAERVSRLLSVVAEETLSVTSADIRSAVAGALVGLTADSAIARTLATTKVLDLFDDVDKARENEGVSLLQFIDGLLADFAARKKQHDGEAKSMIEVAKGSVMLEGDDAPRSRETEIQTLTKSKEEKVSALALLEDKYLRATQVLSGRASHNDTLARIAALEKEIESRKNLFPLPPKEKLDSAAAELTRFTSDLSALTMSRATMEAEQREKQALIDKLSSPSSKQCKCWVCGNSEKGWTEQALKSLKRDMNATAKEIEQVNAKIDAAVTERDAAADFVAKLSKDRETYDRNVRGITNLQSELTELRKQAPPTGDVLTPDELTSLRSAIEKAKSEVTAMQGQLELLKKQHADFLFAEGREKQAADARIKAEQYGATASGFALAIDVLKKLQKNLLTECAESVLSVTRKFTDGILRFDLEISNGDFGYRTKSGAWVSHEMFSGTEKMVCYAGICVALAAESKAKIVLMDELGVADKDTKTAILSRMVQLVREGVIDQFIGVDVSESVVDGVTLARI